MAFSIGIDLGTTNTVVSTGRIGVNGNVEVVTESINQIGEDGFSVESQDYIPSFLYVEDGTHCVGLMAKAMKGQKRNRVIASSKNFMGQSNYEWEIDGECYTPEKVAAYFLGAVKKHLEDKYGKNTDLTNSVITVPASFNLDQRNATKMAAKLTGFGEDVTLISEPTAAILDFINEQRKFGDEYKDVDFKDFKNVLVFDLGGGTCDIAILKIKINEDKVYVEELAVSPHTLIGGFNFDIYVAKAILRDYCKENNIDINKFTKEEIDELENKLVVKAENAKIMMAGQYERYKDRDNVIEYIDKKPYPIQIPEAINGRALKYNLTMSKYNEYINTLLTEDKSTDNIITPITNTMNLANLKVSDIDYVFCVGGMTKYPMVKETIKNYFNKEPLNFLDSMKAVSKGAAAYRLFNVEETNLGENVVSVVPTLPQTVFLNVKNGLPITLIEAKTKAGTPVILENAIKVTSEIAVELELYSGRSAFDPELKKLNNLKLDFPHGVQIGTGINLKMEYTDKGILNFEAWINGNEDIRAKIELEGSTISNEEVEKIKEKYKFGSVGGIH